MSPSGINFRFWLGEQSSNSFFSIDWLDYKGLRFSYYTLYYTYEMIENFANGYKVDLTFYTIYPYINPYYSDYLTDSEIFGNDLSTLFNPIFNVNRDIEYSYVYEESSDGIVYFESWVGGEIDSTFGNSINGKESYDTDIEFGNNFHYVADKNSGIVYGLGRQGWIKGTINDIEVKVSMSCEYQLKNYKISNYQFGNYRDFILISQLNKILVPSI
ncbi:MAG: choice-of-anchor S family protein, partial [Candidatus Heimdallarchaeota archaeon]